MKNNLKLGILLVLILGAGWALIFTGLPFWRELTAVSVISLLIMAAIHERFVFLYAMSAILSYGAFLAFYVFVTTEEPANELPLIYSHLLFTGFLLLYWVLLNAVKQLGYEQDELKRQISLLQKYTGESELLTVHEFIEQAAWLMKSSERHQEEIWFLELALIQDGTGAQRSVMDTMERTIQHTIRQKYDLATSMDDTLYLLLKDTNAAGVQRVVERFQENLQQELNLLEPPYQVKKAQLRDLSQLSLAMEEAG
ncbi:hypothetical protein [Planococcus lenghuensis]|uniref:GGDEF domain-containing protein n=1 Tax=Planococcus lenghuensis TaxID=2213202 RepID=A0A1Q2L0U4_9BACL|nr:hypothetical protein [Planococcus lenghuensis]AQQ54026.1 hypothetical protein B0X71_13580 [Planococcus lenghuensis]